MLVGMTLLNVVVEAVNMGWEKMGFKPSKVLFFESRFGVKDRSCGAGPSFVW